VSWYVVWTRPAAKELGRLDELSAERIRRAVVRFASTGNGDVVKLQGSDAEFRLRVGDRRVRFEMDPAARVLRVLHVLARGSAYRR
jgi:mRNA interferase RelE/StbE